MRDGLMAGVPSVAPAPFGLLAGRKGGARR
jgi:hypothetical protein